MSRKKSPQPHAEQASLFAAVDALLEEAAAQDPLPHPDERRRLRETAGLSQDQVARALAVRRETITSWESGRTDPRPPKRAAYARLLNGLTTLHPPTEAQAPAPTVNAVNTPAPTTTPDAHASETVNAVNAVNAAPAPAPAPAPESIINAVNAPAPTPAAAPVGNADTDPDTDANAAPTVNAVNTQPPTPPATPVSDANAAPTVNAVNTPDLPSSSPSPADATVNAVNAQPPAPPAPPAPTSPPPPQPIINAVNTPTPRTAPKPHPRPTPTHPTARYTHGPLAVLTTATPPTKSASAPASKSTATATATAKPTLTAHAPHGLLLDCPAHDLPSLISWALSPEADLGSPRLHRYGKDSDPLLVLTAEATEALGLPLVLDDRRALRLPDNHPAIKALTRAKWQLTRRGFGPWPRIYRPATAATGRQCVQLAVLPWGALDPRSWGEDTHTLPAPELADLLGSYAERVLTPRGSTAVAGLELMTALRPPTRAAKDETTGTWVSAPVPGSLTRPTDPAPPEAPDEHPVVATLYPRHHQRTPDQVLDEEAYDWIRDPELLTDAECTRTHAVGIDVNMAFAAAANRLLVGIGPAVHVTAPQFDPKLPGSWLADLSGIELDPRLPSPFTPSGRRPTGPAWYATPTLAYARELGHDVHPAEAWVRPDNGPYLDSWYTRLRDAYLATMAALGVTTGMTDAEFLTAMETHKQHDPAQAAVLSAIKATVKGGIGKLRERPQGLGYRPGERWPALERPTWRPDIRAAVIATARVNMHRKMNKLAAVGLHPIAVLSDCAVYLSDGPGPLDFLPRTPDGKPLPGGFRLGVSPGMVKHEGTQPLLWAVGLLDEHHNPARHIKGHDAAADGE
ncbi:helix-turn-helix transcriptional regulator [Streptomyces bambusae]|uniref:telomere-associated protein Tap n=1 Tax=Streptomyces bambusae TaxID=1550616 RepID=UPI001CFFFB3C|nr:helix-turn-helix transcriptional regulator [Streptomyces bambusae]MCB5170395.1 helix-turn-helix transcriptional regulator [Streptomyces bambusae]